MCALLQVAEEGNPSLQHWHGCWPLRVTFGARVDLVGRGCPGGGVEWGWGSSLDGGASGAVSLTLAPCGIPLDLFFPSSLHHSLTESLLSFCTMLGTRHRAHSFFMGQGKRPRNRETNRTWSGLAVHPLVSTVKSSIDL